VIDKDQVRNRRKQRSVPSEADKQGDRATRREILRLEEVMAGTRIDLEELYDQKKQWDDKFGAGDETAPLSRNVSQADKKEDRDTRKEILRLEGSVAGARSDLEELYDRKKEWDHKFGPGSDTALSSKTVRPQSTPGLSVASSAGPTRPRPAPTIVDDDDDALDEDEVQINQRETDEQGRQDNQVETEEQERQRLVKLFIIPGRRTSPAANHIGLLRSMADIHGAYPREFTLQFPLAPSYVNNIPILQHELKNRKIWDEMDTELAKHERSMGYVACSKMYTLKARVHTFTAEQRIIVWSWWSDIWKESINSPVWEMWKQIWDILKEKTTKTLPRAHVGRKSR